MISFTAGALSVDLPNPQLGDSKMLKRNIRFMRAMTGKMYSYPVAKTYKLNMSFRNVTLANLTDLIELIKGEATITYVDYDGVSHTGQFTMPVAEASIDNPQFCKQTTGSHSESWSINLEFEGTL